MTIGTLCWSGLPTVSTFSQTSLNRLRPATGVSSRLLLPRVTRPQTIPGPSGRLTLPQPPSPRPRPDPVNWSPYMNGVSIDPPATKFDPESDSDFDKESDHINFGVVESSDEEDEEDDDDVEEEGKEDKDEETKVTP
ncbi:uncharacterized protein SPSK_10009 [Sporothrix schenckii 1099-18]|uniref:Uncharacterized protein n=1 Tax=Sporothrix schenckii 1099-18 TaxID=1397361 RepID=A0A0F2M5M7_SPOSC|nr:uncharacterized protein SPSK_10009 [Sporothrix schenckii 1099-18]KJR84998.1 hypothetical protein SPSK_10009 [Sporothrix schenckii 1099-18]